MGERVGWSARPARLVVDMTRVTPLAEVLEKLR